jgi:hypothetical protein
MTDIIVRRLLDPLLRDLERIGFLEGLALAVLECLVEGLRADSTVWGYVIAIPSPVPVLISDGLCLAASTILLASS